MFKENGERGVRGDVSFEGPLFTGQPASKGKVKIDVSLRGEEVETKKVVVVTQSQEELVKKEAIKFHFLPLWKVLTNQTSL